MYGNLFIGHRPGTIGRATTLKTMTAISDVRHRAFDKSIGENFIGPKVSYSDTRLCKISMFKSIEMSNKLNIAAVQYPVNNKLFKYVHVRCSSLAFRWISVFCSYSCPCFLFMFIFICMKMHMDIHKHGHEKGHGYLDMDTRHGHGHIHGHFYHGQEHLFKDMDVGCQIPYR